MNKFSRIASNVSSKIMMILILVYLFIKTLVNPVFTQFDKDLANLIPDEVGESGDWLDIIAIGGYGYKPEARAMALFDLGLYFPKEKM
jgi:hypothetical protein